MAHTQAGVYFRLLAAPSGAPPSSSLSGVRPRRPLPETQMAQPPRSPDSDGLLQRVPKSLPPDSVSAGDRWRLSEGRGPAQAPRAMPAHPTEAIYFAVSRATKPRTAPVPERSIEAEAAPRHPDVPWQ